MAFSVSVIHGEYCDKCKSKEGDLLEIRTNGRNYEDRNIIFVHERCLIKAVEAAKKRSAKTETVTT